MSTNNIFSALVVLAALTSPVAALAAEPANHDHQKTKGSGISSVPKGDKYSENCKKTGGEENAKDASTGSKDSKVKCEPKKPTTPTHDHRKMKTQP